MKIDWIKVLIAVLIGALLGFIAYHLSDIKNNWTLAIVCGLFCAITLAGAIAPVFSKKSTNLKVLGYVFFSISVILNFVYALIDHYSNPIYVALNGILLLTYMAIIYSIARNISHE